MKKLHLFLLIGALSGLSANAAPVLEEDFEGWTDFPSSDWTVIDNDVNSSGDAWKLKTVHALFGEKSATAGAFKPGSPRENWLITPEITLADESHKLQFNWGDASYSYVVNNKYYDFQVRVQVAGEESWTTIFSFANKDDVEASGVKWPWAAWTTYQSTLDLTQFKGKKVKIAFVYVKLKGSDTDYGGNSVAIDNVLVEPAEQVTKPIIESSTSFYSFPATYLGTSSHSEVLTFKNTGVGNLEVTGISGLEGTDFSTSIVPGTVSVAKNDEYQFIVNYKPTLTGATETKMIIETNGSNNLEIKLSGTKELIPDGYTYEGFEGATFPPVGWSKNGSAWSALSSSFSGDYCAWGTATMEEKSELISPRLDLSADKEHTITFDFIDNYQQIISQYPQPDNYFRVLFSADGGETWSTIYENENEFSTRIRKTLSLGNPQSDNCYVKWQYYIGDYEAIMQEEDYEFSNIYLDDVLLPPLYGADAVPAVTTPIYPADGAVGINNRDLVLSWAPAQFADKYKLYLGTATDNFDVLKGVEVAETSYKAPRLDCEKTYYWKVVPTNSKGDAVDAPVWSFTVLADQTVSEYPYFQGFEESDAEPVGWIAVKDGYTKWSISKINPFDGTKSMFASGSNAGTKATLTTNEFVIPADKDLQLSFFWGNSAPVALENDDFGAASNTTTAPDAIDAGFFDIYVDNEWHNLAVLSLADCKYWLRERFDLAPYKGKTVSFRWRYELYKYASARGVCLDNIKIEDASACLAYFNASEWKAGEVNNGKSVTASGVFSIKNGGGDALTVQSVAFANSNFSSSLVAGTEIAANGAQPFDITFAAGTEAKDYADNMVVTFTNGQSVQFPVSATTLAADIRYYNFEEDEFGSIAPKGLTVFDEDGRATWGSMAINFPNECAPFACVVINVKPDKADWRNVYPVSGDQVLASFACQSGSASGWIISPQMQATANSQFRFFGKSYATDDEYNDFTPHYFTILVSTTDNKIASFEVAKDKTELPYSAQGKFTEFTVDLSKYAGKKVYVALKHETLETGYVAFFDDFYYEHFTDVNGGISMISDAKLAVYPNPATDVLRVSGAQAEQLTVTNAAGATVKKVAGTNEVQVSDLTPGMYFLTAKTADGVKTMRFIKK